jgi:Sec-independent protein translocase protein TatA
MDSLPMIAILILVFAMILMGEHIKLKKEVRRLGNLMKHLKKDFDKLNDENHNKKEV